MGSEGKVSNRKRDYQSRSTRPHHGYTKRKPRGKEAIAFHPFNENAPESRLTLGGREARHMAQGVNYFSVSAKSSFICFHESSSACLSYFIPSMPRLSASGTVKLWTQPAYDTNL